MTNENIILVMFWAGVSIGVAIDMLVLVAMLVVYFFKDERKERNRNRINATK